MSWGTQEGGVPQPYRIEVESAAWDLARNKEGELVKNKNGENLVNLVLEGKAWRLIENEDGGHDVGEEIEPVDGKHNRRSFLLGNSSQWQDPREDGKKIDSTRGKDEMPWAQSELGRLMQSLIDLLGVDGLIEKLGEDWNVAANYAGHTYDLLPKHDVNADGSPVTYTSKGNDKIDWYTVVGALDPEGGAKKAAPKRRSRAKKTEEAPAEEVSLADALAAAWLAFKPNGNAEEFVEFVQEADNFDRFADLVKLDDEAFDKLMDSVLA